MKVSKLLAVIMRRAEETLQLYREKVSSTSTLQRESFVQANVTLKVISRSSGPLGLFKCSFRHKIIEKTSLILLLKKPIIGYCAELKEWVSSSW